MRESREDGGRRTGLLVVLVLIVGVLAAAGAWRQSNEQADMQDKAATRRAADRLAGVGTRIDASLSGASTLANADGTLDVDAFRAFGRDLVATSDVTALGLEAIVPESDRTAFEAASGQALTDRDANGPVPAAARAVHYPVVAVAPLTEATGSIVGFDLAGDDVRRRAVEEARDVGHTVFSAPVRAQPSGTLSFFVVRPIYRPGGPYDTVAARRANIVGYTSLTFAGAGLADVLTEVLPSGSRFLVRDGGETLASSRPSTSTGRTRVVKAAGRTWKLKVAGTATPDHGVSLVLAGVTVLLAIGLGYELRRTGRRNRALLRSTERAEQLATLAEELLSAGSVADVGRIATTLGRRPIGADATSVGLVQGDVLRVIHGETVPEEYRIGRQDPSLEAPLAFTTAARTGELYLYEDQASYEAAFPDAGGPQIGARAILPLRRADGRVIGSMAHLWQKDHRFDDALRSTMRTVADLTGQSLERARLSELRIEVARQSEELARLAQGLATSRSSDDVMHFLTEGVLAPLGAVHAAVGVIEGDQIRRHYTPGPHTTRVQEVLLDAVPLTSVSPLADAARTGEAVLLADVEQVRQRYPDLVDGWQSLGFVATANLPLRDRRGEPLGALGVAWDQPVDFDQLRDRLDTISGIAGQTLDRARLSDAEHRLVHSIQEGLLVPLPAQATLGVAERYVPAAHDVGMGGDWYEGIARDDGRYTVIVGDVAGHGIAAVAQMAQLRSVLGAMTAFDFPVEEILPLTTALPHRGAPIVASAVIVEIDPASDRLRYVCAGHPPPLLRRPDGEVVVLDGGRQPLLGLPMEERPAGTAPFPVGSVFLGYTDGLIERRDRGIDEGVRLLAEALAEVGDGEPEAIADALLARFVDTAATTDDVVLAIVAHRG